MDMQVLLNADLNLDSFEEAIRSAPSWSKADPQSSLEIARGTLVKVREPSYFVWIQSRAEMPSRKS